MRFTTNVKVFLFIFLSSIATSILSKESDNKQYFGYVSESDIFATSGIFRLIKSDYINEVSEERIATGCLDKIYPQHPSYSEFLSTGNGFKHSKFSDEFIEKDSVLKFSFAVAKFVNSKVSSQQDASQLFLECKQAMARTLDERSEFFTKEEFLQLQSLPQNLGSIGIEIITTDIPEKNTITSVIKSAPADLAGVSAGDVLISIDGINVKSLTGKQVTNLLRGEVDSHVAIETQRNSSQVSLKFNLQRKKVESINIESKLIRPNFGYIRVYALQSDTGKIIAQKLQSLYLENKNDLQGLVLDLRNNTGGLLSQSSAVVAPFLPQNSLVAQLKGRGLEANFELTTNSNIFIRREEDFTKTYLPAYKKVPLVILINNVTASGAEIIAGALQVHKRAGIIGQLSFGMNSVQTFFPMHSGEALKITTARWQTATEKSDIDKPVIPDITTELVKVVDFGTENDITLNRALEVLANNQVK